jgi:hypothetical protein
MKPAAWIVVLACCLLPSTARAITYELGGFVGLDANLGSDALFTLHYSDGSHQTIKPGNGATLAIGAGAMFFDDQPHRLETQLTLGVKYSTMEPTANASLDFIRVPIEWLAFYRNEDWHFRVGGGLSCYLVNSLSGGGDLLIDVHFKPALAGVIEADFVWDAFYAGLRYTLLRLHDKDSNASASANSLGVAIGYFYRL